MLLLLLSIYAQAEIQLSGKVVSFQKDSINTHQYFVTIDTLSTTLVVERGPVYDCLFKAMKSQNMVEFSFDTQPMKLRTCKEI